MSSYVVRFSSNVIDSIEKYMFFRSLLCFETVSWASE